MAVQLAKPQEWNDDWLKMKGNFVTTVTPELAERLLEKNDRNRAVSDPIVRRYAEDMREGRWDPDASDIKLSRNGDLIDGQHRLQACVRAGVPFDTLVRTGVKRETMRHVDLGKRRSITDTFKIEGIKYATGTAGSITMRVRYEAAEAEGRRIGQTLDVHGVRMTPDEALAFHKAHPIHSRAGQPAFQLYKMGPRIKQTTWQAFLAMAGEADDVGAKEWAERLLNGELGGIGDPFTAIMRYLAQPAPTSVPGHRLRNPMERDLLALVKAWNAWRMDSELPKLTVGDNDPLVPLA